MKKLFLLNLIFLFSLSAYSKQKEYDLNTFLKGKTPQEIGTRIAESF